MTNQANSVVERKVRQIASNARVASRVLATASTETKNAALSAVAEALMANEAEIVEANAKDIERGRAGGLGPGMLDRLLLTHDRLQDIANALLELASLPDPVGDIVRGSTLPNGMRLQQVRVPMGVVGMIYESRPNVTVDAAGIALKSGNAVILRGGSAAFESNTALVKVIAEAVAGAGLPNDLVQSIDSFGREGAVALMRARGLVDVLVPRGGASLIQTVVKQAQVPVIETGVGNCHVYVDADVDEAQAREIVINSKTHRTSVCNAAETLLVHEAIAKSFLPGVLQQFGDAGVSIHADSRTMQLMPEGVNAVAVTDDDWEAEYLDLEIAIAVVDSLDAGIEHIQKWSSGHTDAICTTSLPASEQFTARVDSAVVNVNASTRFTDGGQFGLGAEIGISTQKLHARGPMGLGELTTTKWIVHGDGHIR